MSQPYAEERAGSPLARLQYLPHIAAREGNDATLSLILTKARESSPGRGTFLSFLNQKDDDGNTALHLATENGHANAVYKLLCAGAEVDEYDDKYHTALHIAARNGNVQITQHLLDFGSSARVRDSNMRTPLHLAALAGHTDEVSLLIKNGKETLNMEDMDSQAPLFYAAKGHHLDAAKALAEAGANVNARKYGLPLLHQMATLNDADAINVLIEAGADKKLLDFSDRSALYVAAQDGCRNAFASLLKHELEEGDQDNGMGWVLLQRAVEDASLDAVELLLKSEFRKKYIADDTEMEDLLYISAKRNLAKIAKLLQSALILYRKPGENRLWEVLHRAIRDGDPGTVAVLCDIGIDKEARDSTGRNAVYLAAEMHHAAVIDVLKQKKADLAAADDKGETLLHRAIRESNIAALDILVASGALVDAVDHEGKTPLHRAAIKESRAVEILLDALAHVNEEDHDGRTPLHHAVGRVGYDALKIVDMLLRNGGRIFTQDKKKETLLHTAAASGDHRILTLLFDSRKVQKYYQELVNEEGQTALHVAAKHGNLDAVLVLVTQGLSTDALDSSSQTPIQLAIKNGHSRVVNQLLAFENWSATEGAPVPSSYSSYLAMLSGNRETVGFVLNSKAPELESIYLERLYLASTRRFAQRGLKGIKIDETHLAYGEATNNALSWGLPPRAIPWMMRLGFYDYVVLCDDSQSVHDNDLVGTVKNTLDEIAMIAESFTESRITVQFVNAEKSWHSNSGESLRQVADEALRTRREGLALGTKLNDKIVKPMVLDKIDTDTFNKPLVVFVATNGKPDSKEEEAKFFEVIAQCSDYLESKSLGKSSVIFVMSGLAGDAEPGELVNGIKKHKRAKDLVYCVTETLSELMEFGKEPEQAYGPTRKASLILFMNIMVFTLTVILFIAVV
ncbi:unnamed protein product [Clonostachys rosea]|uniref:VWFA domain-containing protein n=1 Tax=Bionectria ochroleuca TaxID=29856 RepID=A0ABY6UBT5_BIOOC|nr:unnamed protein product [Clonostachys rosea]